MRWSLMMCLLVGPVVVPVFCPVAAHAQGCDEAETTLEMGVCLQDALTAADDDLNAVYAQAMDGLQGEGYADGAKIGQVLKAAQRAWITYRDLACASQAALYEGGSMAGIARTGCLLRLTEERTAGLAEFLPN